MMFRLTHVDIIMYQMTIISETNQDNSCNNIKIQIKIFICMSAGTMGYLKRQYKQIFQMIIHMIE